MSRSIILQKTQPLREAHKDTLRSAPTKSKWKIQIQKFKEDAAMKREVALNQGRKRLTLLEQLKILEGPFTNAEEFQEYLDNSEVDSKVKQARMKEVRDTTAIETVWKLAPHSSAAHLKMNTIHIANAAGVSSAHLIDHHVMVASERKQTLCNVL